MIEDRISELEARSACLPNLNNRENTDWKKKKTNPNQSFKDQMNNSKRTSSDIISFRRRKSGTKNVFDNG